MVKKIFKLESAVSWKLVWCHARFKMLERGGVISSTPALPRALLPISYHTTDAIIVCVCVCFLPIHSGHQVRWTYQPGSHRRKVTQDF